MRRSALLFLVAFDELRHEIKWAIQKDIRRLVYMFKPIVDAETKEKIYRVVPEDCDHDVTQYCMFCDKIQPVCMVTTVEGEHFPFCNKCGYALDAYDMESE